MSALLEAIEQATQKHTQALETTQQPKIPHFSLRQHDANHHAVSAKNAIDNKESKKLGSKALNSKKEAISNFTQRVNASQMAKLMKKSAQNAKRQHQLKDKKEFKKLVVISCLSLSTIGLLMSLYFKNTLDTDRIPTHFSFELFAPKPVNTATKINTAPLINETPIQPANISNMSQHSQLQLTEQLSESLEIGHEVNVPMPPSEITKASPSPSKQGFSFAKNTVYIERIPSDKNTTASFSATTIENTTPSIDAPRIEAISNPLADIQLLIEQGFDQLAFKSLIAYFSANPADLQATDLLTQLIGKTPSEQMLDLLTHLAIQQPNNARLLFAIGNMYATQNQWSNAQTFFLKALSLNPNNPDIVFNAAVTSEHLEDTTQALNYYQLALDLAEKHPASFSPETIAIQLHQLQARLPNK